MSRGPSAQSAGYPLGFTLSHPLVMRLWIEWTTRRPKVVYLRFWQLWLLAFAGGLLIAAVLAILPHGSLLGGAPRKKTNKRRARMAKKPEIKQYKEHPSVDQRITDTLRENYMPYAMSVIVSRAIPEIDGFKPSHRKLLYTMYKMGLLNGNRTKSANIVGSTMKLNPHGDAAIYETMVRLTRGNEALLTPFVDSKGNFGKVYSRDMAYAAPRYTEAKLDAFCAELFRDIDTDAVDFMDNLTTARCRSRRCCRPPFPISWCRPTRASRSVWPRIFAALTGRGVPHYDRVYQGLRARPAFHPARARLFNRRRADLR